LHDNVGDVSDGWRECGGGGCRDGVSAVVVVAGKRAMQGGALSRRQHSVINHINKARLLPLRLAALILPQTHLPRACVATGRAGLEFGKGVRK
jgi:hypothetical protein